MVQKAMMRIPGIVGSADLYLRADYCVPVLQRKRVLSKEYWGYALRTESIVPHYSSGIILNQATAS